jgi:uncharacterized cupin superfamily protein
MPEVVRETDALEWGAAGLGVADGLVQVRIMRGALGCEELGVSIVRLKPGVKVTTGHAHPAGEEVYLLVSGRAELKADSDILVLEPLSAVRVPGPTVRALRNPGAEDAVLVVASHPQDQPDRTTFVPGFWPAEPAETPVDVRLTTI